MLISVLVFFKQKTAYEMRISDWSSDVCSSDLLAHSCDASPAAILVHRRESEFGAATSIISVRCAGSVFPGQKAARKRRPHHQAQLLFGEKRNDLALQVPPGDRIIGLHRFESRLVPGIGQPQPLRPPP